jgi:hypothetical protein
MVRSFYVLSGAGIGDTREWTPSATTALRLARTLTKLRRLGVRIEDELGKSHIALSVERHGRFRDAKEDCPRP